MEKGRATSLVWSLCTLLRLVGTKMEAGQTHLGPLIGNLS